MFVSRGLANYSPDNPATFAFCAFHASLNFSDVGQVLFTVEPFQNVPGCAVGKPSPNAVLVDSTASVLSHELIETITDPDGDAWWITNDLDLFFAEIGDVCQKATFVYAVSNLSGRNYEIQPEYSNQAHACVYTTEIDSTNNGCRKGYSPECPFCFELLMHRLSEIRFDTPKRLACVDGLRGTRPLI